MLATKNTASNTTRYEIKSFKVYLTRSMGRDRQLNHRTMKQRPPTNNPNDDDTLPLPDFDYDTKQSMGDYCDYVDEATLDQHDFYSAQINDRISRWRGLFRPHYQNAKVSPSWGRIRTASELTEVQIAHLVLWDEIDKEHQLVNSSDFNGGVSNEWKVEEESPSNNNKKSASHRHDCSTHPAWKAIYNTRRRQHCEMAKSYIQRSTRQRMNGRMPFLFDPWMMEDNHLHMMQINHV